LQHRLGGFFPKFLWKFVFRLRKGKFSL
jgi:hypothetical protein